MIVQTRIENSLMINTVKIINLEDRYQRLIQRVAPGCTLLEFLPEKAENSRIEQLTITETAILAVIMWSAGSPDVADAVCDDFFQTLYGMGREPIMKLLSM